MDNITIVTVGDSITFQFCLDNWILIMHSVLGFLIIIRLFTTMLFAVEDYTHFVLRLYELFLIFLIGALEFYLFDALKVNDNHEFDFRTFYFRFLVIAIFTLVGYLIAFVNVLRNKDLVNYKTEFWLQLLNNIGGVVILIIGQVIVLACDVSGTLLLAIAILSAGIVFTNILISRKYSMQQNPGEGGK